jgi:hypothetical protein
MEHAEPAPLVFPGMRVFSFSCSPGGVALTSPELALLATHPAACASAQERALISAVVHRLRGDAAVEGSPLADVLPAVAQVSSGNTGACLEE